MHIIWLIEAVKQDFSISHSLLGNFATRIFSSASTFEKIAVLEKAHPPSILLVDFEFSTSEIQIRLLSYIATNFPKTPTLILNTTPLMQFPVNQLCNFLLKPVDLFNLIQVIRRILKDEKGRRDNINFEDLIFYPNSHEVEFETADGVERVKLSKQESLILITLIKNFGKTVTRSKILDEAWDQAKVSDRTMDSHISRLRTALAISSRIQLLNVYGKGFTLTKSY